MFLADPCASGLSGSTHSTTPVGSPTWAAAGSAKANAITVAAAIAAAHPFELIPSPSRLPPASITAPRVVKTYAGAMLEHTRTGSGPPIVLLHGIGLDRQVWDPIVPL